MTATPLARHAPAPAAVPARSPGQMAWRRFRRDRVAVASAAVVGFILLVSISAPVICALLGLDTERHIELLSIDNVGFPEGAFGGMSAEHPLGVEPKTGRDVLALLLYGSRTSLVIALGATVLSLGLGVVAGLCAGYFSGWVDSLLSRAMDVLLAFPVLLFSIGLLVVLGGVDHVLFLSGDGLRIAVLIGVIGFFGFPYVGRIIRARVISLRRREFVEAARVLGASNRRILVTELVPNLLAPILVVGTMTIPTRILAEAALSFLGVGIQPPGTSWGQLLGFASHVFTVDPAYMIFPGVTVVITVLAFNLLGDGLRDAFDPKTPGKSL
jgi:peptide/nickel transport system permease protein